MDTGNEDFELAAAYKTDLYSTVERKAESVVPMLKRSTYNDSAGTVTIDIENDPNAKEFFQDLLTKFEDTVKPELSDLEKARIAMRLIVSATPNLDVSGAFHRNRAVTFGQALNSPVDCSDRALAMEYFLKALNLTNDAKMLIGVDTKQAKMENHADVIFKLRGNQFVVITTGDFAGEIMDIDTYQTDYLELRESQGRGTRKLTDWGHSYF